MTKATSIAVEDYLKVIHALGGDQQLVSTNDIAHRLDVRAPSVTGMLKRMAKDGYLNYSPGLGASLSAQGIREARRVIRRHRLLELFLSRVLGLDWSEVDAEAEALEHAVSMRLEEAIAAYLNEPLEDPHGHLIPSTTGELASRQLRRLCDCIRGEELVIREVSDENPARLRRWSQLGFVPGAKVKIIGYEELDDIFQIQVDTQTVQMGSEGLAGLLVEGV